MAYGLSTSIVFFIAHHIAFFSNNCSGLTNSNYTELSQLYQKYKDQGLLASFMDFRLSFFQRFSLQELFPH